MTSREQVILDDALRLMRKSLEVSSTIKGRAEVDERGINASRRMIEFAIEGLEKIHKK